VRACRPCRSGIALRTRRTSQALGSGFPLNALDSLGAGVAGIAFRALRACRPCRSSIALRPCRTSLTLDAWWTLGAGVARVALRPLRSCFPCRTRQPLRPLLRHLRQNGLAVLDKYDYLVTHG